MNDYVRFEPQQGLHDDDDAGYGKDLMMSDDEDDDQPEQKGQGLFGMACDPQWEKELCEDHNRRIGFFSVCACSRAPHAAALPFWRIGCSSTARTQSSVWHAEFYCCQSCTW